MTPKVADFGRRFVGNTCHLILEPCHARFERLHRWVPIVIDQPHCRHPHCSSNTCPVCPLGVPPVVPSGPLGVISTALPPVTPPARWEVGIRRPDGEVLMGGASILQVLRSNS